MSVELATQARIEVVTKGGEPAADLIAEHEEAFLAIMLEESDRALFSILLYVERYGDVDGLRLPLSGIERAAFADLVLAGEAGWAWGHGEILTSLRSRYRIRVRKADFDPTTLFETEARLYGMPRSFSAQYMQRRELELAGVYEQARLRQTKVIVERAIREGHGIPGIQQKLGKQFPSFTEARLRNIARTESNTLFSHGKYARLQVSPYVIGYEFFATMDARTTDICASRHGHHYARGSNVDVPPLHFSCRSELLPIFTDEKIKPTPLPADAPPPLSWKGKRFGRAPDITGFQEKLARQRPLPALWVPKGKRKIKPRPKPRRRVRPVSAPLRAKLLGAATAVRRRQASLAAAGALTPKQRAALLREEEEE